ncbi:MAG: chloride channel protein [Actinomycetia bacterium]|nr:chloride channel protein [Actinomycetes bacterium]
MQNDTRPPLRTAEYWVILTRSALIGAFGGVFAVVFLGLEHTVRAALWGDLGESFSWFSGGARAFLIPVAAGLVIGGLYLVFRLPPRIKGFLEELQDGHSDPRTAPGTVVVSFVSLIGGASLGPEAPLVTAAAGFGNMLTQRANASVTETRTATFSGAAGALGALLSSPFIGALFAFELERERGVGLLFRHIIPGGVSGVVAFAIVYPVLGSPFLGIYSFPEFEFSSWYLLAGVGIGAVGAVLGIIIGMVGKLSSRIAMRVPGPVLMRSGLGGVIIGLIAFAMPATLFSGIDALGVVVDDPASLGIGLLVGVVVLKIVTLSVSMTSGFYGGPFFPTFFIGGTIGAVIHLLFPAFPLALAVGATMAATAAIAGIPFSIVVLGVYVVGVGPPAASVIAIAVITSIAITHGLGVVGQWSAAGMPDGAEGDAPA